MKDTSVSTVQINDDTGLARISNVLRKFLADAAPDWNLSPTKVAIICILPFVVAFLGASTALLGKPAYKLFTGEDAIAETLQVLFYATSAILSLITAVRYWRSGEKLIGVLFVGLSGALFFLIGEELSWGQRLIGWETADSFAAINKQGETNLHNVYGVGSTFKWIQMLVGAYGTIIPLLIWRWDRLQPYRDRLWSIVPHYTLVGYFVMLFAWRIFRNLFDPPQDFYFVVSEYNEVLELVLALGFFFFLVFQLRRLGRHKRGISDAQ